MRFVRRVIVLLLLGSACTVHGATLGEDILARPWQTLDGDVVRLEAFRGEKPVYLKFWATWCGTCMEEMPHLQAVYDEFGGQIEVLAVNLSVNDDIESVTATRDSLQLTTPIVLDESGDLAQALGLVGTPYHVLLDRDLETVHQSYGATPELDDRIRRLAAGEDLEPVEVTQAEVPAETPADALASDELSALFFIATWCDWYLAERRPEMAANCVAAQQSVNRLARKYPGIEWTGVVSRMWTGEQELAEYRERFDVQHELWLDASNTVIQRHEVRQFPTLVLFRDGVEWLRIHEFDDFSRVSGLIAEGLGRATPR